MLTDIKAKWKKLLFINYQVDESILRPYLPYGTELALWNGSSYISLIGFLFIDTTISGIPIPLHTNFTEINFRFYVRNLFNGQWRYGVVFIREIVGLPMVTFVANRFFNEHYKTMRCGYEQNVKEGTQSISYRWKRKKWNCISIQSPVESNTALPGSHEEFLTAQHWGFTKVNDVRTRVYSVEHPQWKIYSTIDYSIDVDFSSAFGKSFQFLQSQPPSSVFLVEGSEIVMKKAESLKWS